MLLLAFAVAVALYGFLCFACGALSPHLGGVTTSLQALRVLVFHVPDASALLLLKEMLALTALYIAFDWMLSCLRFARRPATKRNVR